MATPEERVGMQWIREQDIKHIRHVMANLETLKRKAETLKGQLSFIDTAYKQGSGKKTASFDKQHFERIKSDLLEVERLSRSISRIVIGDLASAKRILNKIR